MNQWQKVFSTRVYPEAAIIKRMLEENPNTDKELVALVKNELNRKD